MQDTSVSINKPRFVHPGHLLSTWGIGKSYVIAGLVMGLAITGFSLLLLQIRNKEVWRDRLSIFGQIGTNTPQAKPQDVPRPIQNVLTGMMYTEAEAKDWQDLRPLGVMVNNHPDARPQAGLIDADFTYEMVAEGGITRFLAFYHSILPDKVGPIRSIREYYLVLTREMGDAMVMHHGYSPQASAAIDAWGVRSLDKGAAPYWRENPRNVAIEHTLYASAKAAVDRGIQLGWEGKTEDFYVWQFKDAAGDYQLLPKADKIAYDFWYQGDFSAMWQYDAATNSYLRFMGFDAAGKELPHVDELTAKQLAVKNLIVQFATESKIAGDEKNRLDYTLVGSGKGYVFMDGRAIEVTWSKAARDARTKYYDTNGLEIKFNRGKFWVAILPDRSPETLKFI